MCPAGVLVVRCDDLIPTKCGIYEISPCDEEEARRDNMDIQWLVDQGHTLHCAQRQVWGDGECECAITAAGYDPYKWQKVSD